MAANNEAIGIAGAGRIAQALGRLLRERGEPVVAVASRDREHARTAAAFLGAGVQPVSYDQLPSHAVRLLIAVPDDAIRAVAGTLAAASGRVSLALHTCGARGPEVLAPLAERGASCGVLHPLQTVPTPAEGVEKLCGIAFAISGDTAAVQWAEQLAALLDGQVLRIAPADMPIYHAAAAIASNYIVGLVDASIMLMRAIGIDEVSARHALAPLLRASTENAIRLGPVKALTGPIERGDAETVAGHLRALAGCPEALQQLYRVGGLQILDIARRRGLPAEAAAKLESLLREKGPRVQGSKGPRVQRSKGPKAQTVMKRR